MSGSNVCVVIDVFSAMATYFIQTCYACVQYTVQKRNRVQHCLSLHSVLHTRTTGLNKICHHSTEDFSNDTHIGTSHAILAKHSLWLPDDGFM
jgi:Na+-translocating ferredoxin:NAD+ oxidoreductase RnfG subunit